MSVTLDDEAFAAIKEVLASADELCTSVISGKSGTIKTAINVATALTNLKRKKIITIP